MKHGMSNTPEYNAWKGMLGRCYGQKDPRYKFYGGRGIKVCDEWRHDFMAFYRSIGPKPDPRLTLDRINNDGDYEPGNVRWASWLEQARNRRKPNNPNPKRTDTRQKIVMGGEIKRAFIKLVGLTQARQGKTLSHEAVIAPIIRRELERMSAGRTR